MEKPITAAETGENIAETLARELKKPFEIAGEELCHVRRIALPPGWTIKEIDDEALLETPRRKKAVVNVDDSESFIAYIGHHLHYTGQVSIWVQADYSAGRVAFTGILNDHGAGEEDAAWRDHIARFSPKISEEWKRWMGQGTRQFSQVEFAAWLENQIADIVEDGEGSPSGAQMLQMALHFEANQDKRFKSAIRLQSGGVDMTFVENDDAQTADRMKMFDRFQIGVPVFWGGAAYRVDARLRYRVREGKLVFWYELIRADKVLEAATKTLIEAIKVGTGQPTYFGNPFGA